MSGLLSQPLSQASEPLIQKSHSNLSVCPTLKNERRIKIRNPARIPGFSGEDPIPKTRETAIPRNFFNNPTEA